MSVNASVDYWAQVELGDIAEFVMGQAPKKSECNYVGEGTVFVKAGEFSVIKPVIKEWTTNPLKHASENDVLICVVGATAGKLNLGIDCAIGRSVAAIRPLGGVQNTFIYQYLRTQVTPLRNGSSGSAQGVISKTELHGVTTPFPPLAEQKVIADTLDTLLAQVENTKARLERIPQILKRFRQSVLAAAVSGRLTEEWRNLSGLPKWEAKFLGDVTGSIDQGWSPKCHNEPASDESWGVIKTSSVLPMKFVENENKKLPDSLDVRPHLRVLTSDILTTRAGPRSRCGITCYVSSTSKNLMICDKVYRYRVIEEKGSSKFLALQLNSPHVLEEIETLKTGISESGMNLTQKKFRQLKLCWPTPAEQTQIVRQVDQLFAHADRIEQQVNNALARVNNLTQSILAKAFRGELTEQWRKDNPELISGENSAEVLLEKIKAERVASQPPKRRKRKV